MKLFTKFFCLICSLTLCVCSISCTPKGSAIDFYYFNSDVHIETYQKTIDAKTIEQLNSLFSSLEKEFSASDENSVISALNNCDATTKIPISQTAMEIFTVAKACYEFTDKKFNPACLPLVKLWQFFPKYPVENFTPPDNHSINQVINSGALDYESVLLDSENLTLTKTNQQTQLDFGGILKGYAAQKVAELLKSKGFLSGYVNVGGSSLYLLDVDSLSIRHPRNTKNTPNVLSINLTEQTNVAVSTSGDYEKFYTYNGKIYSHIINPIDGYPSNMGIMSATVMCDDGAFADAITTALCLCSHSHGDENSQLVRLIKKTIEKYPSSKIFVLYEHQNGKSIITNQTENEDFTLLDTEFTIFNI